MKNMKYKLAIFLIMLISFQIKCDDLIEYDGTSHNLKNNETSESNFINQTKINHDKKKVENDISFNTDKVESVNLLKDSIEKDLRKIITNNNIDISNLSLIEESNSNQNKTNLNLNNNNELSRFRFSEKSSTISNDKSSITSNPQNSVNGSIIINGQKYIAVCDCGENAKESNPNNFSSGRSEVNSSACDPSKIKITTEMTGYGANVNQIKDLIGNLDELEFVKLEEETFNCLDGRNKYKGVSTPGGDAGEFILALDVYENLLLNDKKLDKEMVDSLFRSYLKYMKPSKFRMCTDNKAIEFIKTEIQVSKCK
jgi:hypothetical protein